MPSAGVGTCRHSVSDLEQTLRRAVSSLRELGVGFAVVGGLAVSARTEPRFTCDADLCVAVRDDREAEALVHDLRGRGYEVLALVEQEAVGRLATARLADTRSAEGQTVVDLLFASSGVEREIVQHAETLQVFEGLEVPVATVSALLALKVLARDDRTRPQDRADALALLGASTPEDLERTRALLRTIQRRGFARERDLLAALDALSEEAAGST